MKIIDIRTFVVSISGAPGSQNALYVKVISDEHLHGVGEAYRVGPDDATEKAIHHFKDWLIGEDPRRIEHLWRIMFNGIRFPGGSVINAAISGIDQALWDLKAKSLGVPVYELLGGRCRDKVRVYRGIGGNTAAEAAADAKRAVQEGFTAVKMGPFPAGGDQMRWGEVLREAGKRIEAVRLAVGDGVDIGVDPHAKIFNPVRSLQLSEVIKPYNPFFYEEPILPENIEALSELHKKVGVPIATGETLYTKYAFRDLLARHAADIVQPDLAICGGLMEAKKIAAMAEAFYVQVAPHNPLSPVNTAVCTHFAASTPNFLILEYIPDSRPPLRDLVLEPMKFVDGYLQIPDKPGYGIELNEELFPSRPMTKWRRGLVIEADGNIGYI